MGKSIVRQVILSKQHCIILSNDLFTFTDSVDPDDMQHYAAFHLGLHCLKKYSLRGFSCLKKYSLRVSHV